MKRAHLNQLIEGAAYGGLRASKMADESAGPDSEDGRRWYKRAANKLLAQSVSKARRGRDNDGTGYRAFLRAAKEGKPTQGLTSARGESGKEARRAQKDLTKEFDSIKETSNMPNEDQPLSEAGKDGEVTVRTWLTLLSGAVTREDQRLAAQERKRGGKENVYRLGIMMDAVQRIEKSLSSHMNRSHGAAIKRLREEINKNFNMFPALKKLLKKIDEYEKTGKAPKYEASGVDLAAILSESMDPDRHGLEEKKHLARCTACGFKGRVEGNEDPKWGILGSKCPKCGRSDKLSVLDDKGNKLKEDLDEAKIVKSPKPGEAEKAWEVQTGSGMVRVVKGKSGVLSTQSRGASASDSMAALNAVKKLGESGNIGDTSLYKGTLEFDWLPKGAKFKFPGSDLVHTKASKTGTSYTDPDGKKFKTGKKTRVVKVNEAEDKVVSDRAIGEKKGVDEPPGLPPKKYWDYKGKTPFGEKPKQDKIPDAKKHGTKKGRAVHPGLKGSKKDYDAKVSAARMSAKLGDPDALKGMNAAQMRKVIRKAMEAFGEEGLKIFEDCGLPHDMEEFGSFFIKKDDKKEPKPRPKPKKESQWQESFRTILGEASDPPVIRDLRQIVGRNRPSRVGGSQVDVYTAKTILDVYDKLNPGNRAAMAKHPMAKMADIAFKLSSKARR